MNSSSSTSKVTIKYSQIGLAMINRCKLETIYSITKKTFKTGYSNLKRIILLKLMKSNRIDFMKIPRNFKILYLNQILNSQIG